MNAAGGPYGSLRDAGGENTAAADDADTRGDNTRAHAHGDHHHHQLRNKRRRAPPSPACIFACGLVMLGALGGILWGCAVARPWELLPVCGAEFAANDDEDGAGPATNSALQATRKWAKAGAVAPGGGGGEGADAAKKGDGAGAVSFAEGGQPGGEKAGVAQQCAPRVLHEL